MPCNTFTDHNPAYEDLGLTKELQTSKWHCNIACAILISIAAPECHLQTQTMYKWVSKLPYCMQLDLSSFSSTLPQKAQISCFPSGCTYKFSVCTSLTYPMPCRANPFFPTLFSGFYFLPSSSSSIFSKRVQVYSHLHIHISLQAMPMCLCAAGAMLIL